MTARGVLGDERGQSLVFVVLAVGTLVAVLGLVVSVGDWMRTRQRAQSVADAAALAGAQELPDQSAAASEAASSAVQNNWLGSPLQSGFPDQSTIQVDASQDVSGLFAPIVGVFNLTIEAHARASVGAPATVTNVAPVGLKCNASCTEWNGTDSFTFNRNTPGSNTLAPLQLPGVRNRNDFTTFVQCDVQNPSQGTCNQADATAPLSYAPLVLGRGNAQAGRLRSALQAAEGPVHLIPVFASYSSSNGYDVVGWAVGTFSVEQGGGQNVTLDVTFQRMIVDGTSLVSGNGPKPSDFGVRAIALTG